MGVIHRPNAAPRVELFHGPERRRAPRTVAHDHTVEIGYMHGVEHAKLVRFDATHVTVRLPYQTQFTTFANHCMRVDHRMTLRSTARGVNGNYALDQVEAQPDGTYLITLAKSKNRSVVDLDLAVQCMIGDELVVGAFNSMSAVGGTVQSPVLSKCSGRMEISFSLGGTTFAFPSAIEDVRNEQVHLAFQPITAEPLEAIAGILNLTPPPAGHLSLGYISRHVAGQRSEAAEARRAAALATKPAVEPAVEPPAAIDDRRPRHAVLWADLPSQRVERVA